MTVTVRALVAPKQAEDSQTTQYESINSRAIIDKFTVTNTTGAADTISVNLIPMGGTADDTNLIIDAKSVAAGETWQSSELIGHVIESGGKLSTIAGAAATLTIAVTGRVIT